MWAVSFLVASLLFTFILSGFFLGINGFFLVLRVTMIFALPVWCLFLRVVIAFQNKHGERNRTILISGILVGPLALSVWSIALLFHGYKLNTVLFGDPLAGGVGGLVKDVILSLILGSMTTLFYLRGLKRLNDRLDKREQCNS